MKKETFIDSYLSTNPSSLWHYTSFEALRGILDEDALNRGNMNFWFCNPLQTNDNREVRFFQEYLFKGKEGETIQEKVENIQSEVGRPFTLSLIHHREGYKTYPFCEIPMWNMYGRKFEGVRLCFDASKLKEYCKSRGTIELLPCQYLTKQKMDEITGNIRKRIKEKNESIEDTYKASVCYKSCCWAYENEWRLVAWVNNVHEIQYRPDGKLYVPLKLPLKFLKTVEIGSKADIEAIRGYLSLIKEKHKNATFKIKESKLQIGYV